MTCRACAGPSTGPGRRHPRDLRGHRTATRHPGGRDAQQGSHRPREAGLCVEGAPGTEIHPEVAPRPGDVVVTKRRAGAFSGSDLDVVLRARGIDSLVLTGIATGAVVLSALCRANDLDFGLTVLSCLDTDPEVHRVLVERLFPRWADVVTVDAWAESVSSPAT
ncbi:cysteine hydrolase family protein [Streptomyces sp. NPDC092370]|uniref:cysteine hydrolase family protein n=1 Tax=Streptomyces sp. NPDC092370 TaxID=3366016 RepID=UPI0037F65D9D